MSRISIKAAMLFPSFSHDNLYCNNDSEEKSLQLFNYFFLFPLIISLFYRTQNIKIGYFLFEMCLYYRYSTTVFPAAGIYPSVFLMRYVYSFGNLIYFVYKSGKYFYSCEIFT